MHTYSYIAISYSTPEKEESAADSLPNPPFSLIPFFVPSGIRTWPLFLRPPEALLCCACVRARWRKEEGSLGKPPLTFSLPTKRRLVGGEELAEKLPVGRDLFFFNYPLGIAWLIRPDQTGRQREGWGRRVETQRDIGCSLGRGGRVSWGGEGSRRRWGGGSWPSPFLPLPRRRRSSLGPRPRRSSRATRQRGSQVRDDGPLFSLRLFPSCFWSW